MKDGETHKEYRARVDSYHDAIANAKEDTGRARLPVALKRQILKRHGFEQPPK